MHTVLPYLAISMGLISSFHCVAMCGPIALALPVHKGSRWQQNAGLLSYNLGRAITYACMGLLIGTLSSSIAWIGYLRFLSIGAGFLILAYVIFSTRIERHINAPKIWKRSIDKLKKNMARLLKSDNYLGWLSLGMLNGLLPCGMVYLALISSMATGSMTGSAGYMFLFGIGTIPMMMLIGSFRTLVTPELRTRMRRIIPYALASVGIWLVVRGVVIAYPNATSDHNSAIAVCRTIVSRMIE